MKEIFTFIGVAAVSMAISLVPAYIVWDIASLYQVPVVEKMTFVQVYGAVMIANLTTGTKTKEDKEIGEQVMSVLRVMAAKILVWRMLYLMYAILT